VILSTSVLGESLIGGLYVFDWNDEKQFFTPFRKRERCFSVGYESFKSYVLISYQRDFCGS
jgi:hypothetical protein